MKALKTTMAIAAVALLFVTACNDKDTEWVTAPSISPTSAVVTAPDEGGSVSLTYTVSNPVDDATTTASASASWISDVSVPSEGTVTFTVDANSSLEPRTGRITITYSYTLAGTKGTASCDVTVAQSCGDEPAISVQPTAVAAGAEGGSYYFEYTIVNPSAEGTVDATTEAAWITDIDTATDGKVSFTVAENTGGLRESEITITYTYPGGSVSDAVEVVQDFPEEGGEGAPEITVTHPAITVAIEGGSYSFEYEVLHPADDGKMEVATEEEWIEDLTDASGTVSFSVGENEDSELRSGVITLTYTYSEGSVSETVTVVQDHAFLSEITGTYLAEGYGLYASGTSGDTTWNLYIIENESDPDSYYVYCLTPYAGGLDIASAGVNYWATGHYGDDETTFIIPSQVCSGQVTSGTSRYYFGYTPCTDYADGSYYYSSQFPDLTFTMTSTNVWESDYGIFAGGFTGTTLSTFKSYFGAVAPSIKITRTGEAPSSLSAALNSVSDKPIEALEVNAGMLAK